MRIASDSSIFVDQLKARLHDPEFSPARPTKIIEPGIETPFLQANAASGGQLASAIPLPDSDAGTASKKSFKAYPIDYLHIDIAEVRTGQGKHHLFVVIDRMSKFVVARLETQATRQMAAAFLDHVIDVLP